MIFPGGDCHPVVHSRFLLGLEGARRHQRCAALRFEHNDVLLRRHDGGSGSLIEYELLIWAGRFDGRGSGWQADGSEEGLNGCVLAACWLRAAMTETGGLYV